LPESGGGDGWLEIDTNDNPLRDLFCGSIINVREGTVELDETPGLGIAPDRSCIERYRS
jgi:L-alanine-DL-glutamate epimerase-like enolase superfamily enzyme